MPNFVVFVYTTSLMKMFAYQPRVLDLMSLSPFQMRTGCS
jgi:hypothetical protein